MKLKNTAQILLLLLSYVSFAQNGFRNPRSESQNFYLDSIKSTFIHDKAAARVDSLWMKELTNLDIYNDLSVDIKNVNMDEAVDYELSTALLKERLKKMDEKSPFNIEYNKGLENIIKSFLKNRKKSFERLMAISEYYFPMFEESLSRQNVPLEIKYLAVVESALNPKAVSRVGATGLWQFMYQTGKEYNLDINSYVDERSDPLKASDAAALYMSNMYKIFGDWELVLASYNSGAGNVTKAIRRSGGKQSFWGIRKKLPKETQGYVPAFLATMYIYEYHKEHGIVPNRAIIKHFATDTIKIKQQISFKQLSDLLDIPVSQLQLLNPSYKRDVVPYVSGEKHSLRLPNDKIAIYTSNENKIYAYLRHEANKRERPYSWDRAVVVNQQDNSDDDVTVSRTKFYKVKRGDNLGEIAEKFDVAVSDIKKWNKLKSSKVASGRSLKIRISERVATTAKKQPKETNDSKSENKDSNLKENKEDIVVVAVNSPGFYVVQKGDNLNSIAKKHNATLEEIKEWNNLEDNYILLGTKLRISKIIPQSKEQIAQNGAFETLEYVVVKGDNLGSIAQRNNVTISDLKEWNNLADSNIKLGASLIVSKKEIFATNEAVAEKSNAKSRFATTSKKQQEEYYVKKGDSLFSIAKKYPGVTISDIKKWNGISNENLKPGMKLKING